MPEPPAPDFFPPVVVPVCYQFRDEAVGLLFKTEEMERLGMVAPEPEQKEE
jgi:hypothetical protein